MKKYIWVLFAIIILAGTSCQETIDIEKEKNAIIAVIQEEGDAFAANDLDRISAIHIQDGTQTRLQQGVNSYEIISGWDDIKKLYEGYIERNLTADTSLVNPKNLKENIIINIVGNSAWVLCDNIWEYEYNSVSEKNTNLQIAFLEKVDGAWKFSFNAFVQRPVAEPIE